MDEKNAMQSNKKYHASNADLVQLRTCERILPRRAQRRASKTVPLLLAGIGVGGIILAGVFVSSCEPNDEDDSSAYVGGGGGGGYHGGYYASGTARSATTRGGFGGTGWRIGG